MNRTIAIVIACVAFVMSARSASAEVTYRYTGSGFSLFSCGPNSSNNDTQACPSPAPANPLTSYTASEFVSITLTFDDPLPPNFPPQVVHTRPDEFNCRLVVTGKLQSEDSNSFFVIAFP